MFREINSQKPISEGKFFARRPDEGTLTRRFAAPGGVAQGDTPPNREFQPATVETLPPPRPRLRDGIASRYGEFHLPLAHHAIPHSLDRFVSVYRRLYTSNPGRRLRSR